MYNGLTVGTDGRFYFLGGYTGNSFTNAVETYDPATDTWGQLPAMPPVQHDYEVIRGIMLADGTVRPMRAGTGGWQRRHFGLRVLLREQAARAEHQCDGL